MDAQHNERTDHDCIREKIREGLDAAKRGEVVSADEVWADLDRLDAESESKQRSASESQSGLRRMT